jgi:hypothetical protein
MTPLLSSDMSSRMHIQRDLPDPTDIITKVDTSDGSKGAHEVCLEGNRGLNAVDISRTADG